MQDCVGMQTKRLIEPTKSISGTGVRLVGDDLDKREFCNINGDSYKFSSEWCAHVALWTSQWPNESVRLYLAFAATKQSSSATVYLVGDVAYLGFVGRCE
jgi:hypothetical protein